jgi:hypothetical protein
MSNARNPLSALAFFAVLGGIVYFARHYGDGDSGAYSYLFNAQHHFGR